MGLDALPFVEEAFEDARDADLAALEVEGDADLPVQPALEAAGDANVPQGTVEIQPLAGSPQQPTPEGNRGFTSTRIPNSPSPRRRRGSTSTRIPNSPPPRRRRVESSPRELPNQFLTRWYPRWERFTIFWALILSLLTPFEVGFLFVGSTTWLFMLLDSATTLLGIGDLAFEIYFCHKGIHIPQNKYHKYWQWTLTAFDVVGCLPWIVIYKVWKREWQKFFSMLRVFRARKVYFFIQERKDKVKDHFCSGIFWDVLQILFVILLCVHTEGCIFYFIATLSSSSGNTWIGFGAPDQDLRSYHHFGRNYLSSLYFATVTFFTIGYGDFHPVNDGEMVFNVMAIIFNFVVAAYLTVRITLLCQRKEREEGGES